MPYQLVYRQNATTNIRAAKAWYKQQRPGLQKTFASSVKEAVIRLQTTPEAFAVRYRNVRIVHTHTFPFSIHFYIDDTKRQLVITNIIHDKRDFGMEQ